MEILTLYGAFKTVFLYDTITCLLARVQHYLCVHLGTAWSFNLGCGVFVILFSRSVRENAGIMNTTEPPEYVNIFLVCSDAVEVEISLRPRSAL